MKIINSINELRKNNKKNILISNKLEILNTFFQEKKSKNENYTFIYPLGEFKNKMLKKEENVIKILLIDNLRYIIILEKEYKEYIFLYSNKEKKVNIKTNDEIKNNRISNYNNFNLINNTFPKINAKNFLKWKYERFFKVCLRNNDYGYQLLHICEDSLLGVLEGPPDTPYENGYFLFKILFPDFFPFPPIKFCFITSIFHPNISEGGYVCADIFNEQWSPALGSFPKIIYSVQSLLDDPNPDDFMNEIAAKLYKKDRNIYNETVRYYTSQFANYSKFLENVKNFDINYENLNKEKKLNDKRKNIFFVIKKK